MTIELDIEKKSGAMYPNLKLQMWRAGVRQNRLAQEIGIHESVLSRMLNGFRTPTPAIRAKIATVLKCEENWLFDDCANFENRRGMALPG
jgi:transcriptional regulator with XRE-family HTH domain